VSVALVLRNAGLTDALGASLDNPLPWPLRLVTGTISSGGIGIAEELPGKNRIRWQGNVAVGGRVTLTYRAAAPPVLQEGLWLYNAAHLEDGMGGSWEQGDWLYVWPYRYYFPILSKGG
jgi:hypothetical protein